MHAPSLNSSLFLCNNPWGHRLAWSNEENEVVQTKEHMLIQKHLTSVTVTCTLKLVPWHFEGSTFISSLFLCEIPVSPYISF